MLSLTLPCSGDPSRLTNALLALQSKTLLERHLELNELQSQPYVITTHADGRVTTKPMRIVGR
jgi:hypothetical protein